MSSLWQSPPPPTRQLGAEHRWWEDPLADDIHQNMLLKEKTQLPTYFARSPQLKMRRYLVDWLAVVCDKCDLCTIARHLTITLLDFFMDKFDISEPQLKLVGLGCLLVSSKFEEHELNVPKQQELNIYVPAPGYSPVEYLQIELALLEFFHWNIGYPTAAHFIDYFLCLAVDSTDLHGIEPIQDISRAKVYMSKYSQYFLEISLQDHTYRDYKPSLVAAACVGSSRLCLSIQPPWTETLKKRTGYQWNDLLPLVHSMMKTHQIDEIAAQRARGDMDTPPTLTPTATPGTHATCTATPTHSVSASLSSVYYTPSPGCYAHTDCATNYFGVVSRIS